MIRFLNNSEIDHSAWDTCILNSTQGLIYPMSWYLDLVSPGWCGLVEDNYINLMPLPVKKKYGISYIIQPLYAQQLGVFSAIGVGPDKVVEFLNAIPKNFKFISVNLNYQNQLQKPAFHLKANSNFILDMNKDYKSIASGYSENTRRNIMKAKELEIHFDGKLEDLLFLKSHNTAKNRRNIPAQFIETFIATAMLNKSGIICSASLGGEVCASVFFLQNQKRIYYLIPVSNPVGKEKKAMFAIIDSVMKKYAGSDMILDFEGSNIPGIARFFEGFGSVHEDYNLLTINHLPFPLNQFRKH